MPREALRFPVEIPTAAPPIVAERRRNCSGSVKTGVNKSGSCRTQWRTEATLSDRASGHHGAANGVTMTMEVLSRLTMFEYRSRYCKQSTPVNRGSEGGACNMRLTAIVTAMVLCPLALAWAQRPTPVQHPYGLDPYKPSDAELLRNTGACSRLRRRFSSFASLIRISPVMPPCFVLWAARCRCGRFGTR